MFYRYDICDVVIHRPTTRVPDTGLNPQPSGKIVICLLLCIIIVVVVFFLSFIFFFLHFFITLSDLNWTKGTSIISYPSRLVFIVYMYKQKMKICHEYQSRIIFSDLKSVVLSNVLDKRNSGFWPRFSISKLSYCI